MIKPIYLVGHLSLSKKGIIDKCVPVRVPFLQESVYQLFQWHSVAHSCSAGENKKRRPILYCNEVLKRQNRKKLIIV